jgi:hypothetical protein
MTKDQPRLSSEQQVCGRKRGLRSSIASGGAFATAQVQSNELLADAELAELIDVYIQAELETDKRKQLHSGFSMEIFFRR